MIDATSAPVTSCAIGVDVGGTPIAAGIVNPQGRVASSHTLPWRDLAVRERFARLAPGILDADSRAAAFCEARCGTGQRFRSLLYATLGTGMGSSLRASLKTLRDTGVLVRHPEILPVLQFPEDGLD